MQTGNNLETGKYLQTGKNLQTRKYLQTGFSGEVTICGTIGKLNIIVQ